MSKKEHKLTGNQFWKLRTQHGRKALFEDDAILLWNECVKFFEWCDENPKYKNEAIKSGDRAGQIVQIPTERPYTLGELATFLGISKGYFWMVKKRCELKKDQKSNDFLEIITRVEEIIYTQKFVGAAVGAYNANLIARELGIVDKKDITTGGDKLKMAPRIVFTKKDGSK